MRIEYLPEPKLAFGAGQSTEDPRDGLLLYGPFERWGNFPLLNPYSISAGIIGTPLCIQDYRTFVDFLKSPIVSTKRTKRGTLVSNATQRPSFPGFSAVFDIQWPLEPDITKTIDKGQMDKLLYFERNKQARVNKLVDLYLDMMLAASSGEDPRVNIWFVLVPRDVYLRCRSESPGKKYGTETRRFFEQQEKGQDSLFSIEEMFGEDISEYMDSSNDFHNLLKAKANQARLEAPIQIIVQPKLHFRDILTNKEYSDDMKAFLAWCLSTTLYYKLGKKPWKLFDIRPGVCYLGLVFKRFPFAGKENMVCSAAQLFLSDGDGTVFRGNNGLWLSEKPNEYHLDESEAFHLMDLALTDYSHNNGSQYPTEFFIHGRATFSAKEWNGFERAMQKHGAQSNLVGVVIRDAPNLKLFRQCEGEPSDYGVLRGTAIIIDERSAYLFTNGFVPRLGTSTSMEVPNPLEIRITRGDADIMVVLNDIMKLTKLNYNSCIYGDGKPVTLRFSDKIGGVLTATEDYKEERRQFIYYI